MTGSSMRMDMMGQRNSSGASDRRSSSSACRLEALATYRKLHVNMSLLANNVQGSVADPTFFHPGSRIRIKEFKYFNPKKMFSKL